MPKTISQPNTRPKGGKAPMPERTAAASQLIDEETLDLTVPEPVATAHLSLNRADYFKAHYYKNCWALDPGETLGLTLHLDEQDQMTLTYELYAPEDPSIRYFCQSLGGSWNETLYFNLYSDRGSFNAQLESDPLGQSFVKITTPLVPLGEQNVGDNTCTLNYSGTLKPLFVRAVTLKRFRVQRQEQSEWCHAAVTASLLSLLNPTNETQSEVVGQVLPGQTNDLNHPQDLSAVAKKLGLAVKYTSRQLRLYELRDGLRQGLPIPLQINWLKVDAQGQPVLDQESAEQWVTDSKGDPLGHYVVLTDIKEDVPAGDDQVQIKIEDPSKGELWMSFAELKEDYPGAANKHLYNTPHSGRWTYTHRIEKKPASKGKPAKYSAPKLTTPEERAAFCQQWAQSRPAESGQERFAAVENELAQLRQMSENVIHQPAIEAGGGMQADMWTEEREQRLTTLFQQQLRLFWVRAVYAPKVLICSAPIPYMAEVPKPHSFFDKKK